MNSPPVHILYLFKPYQLSQTSSQLSSIQTSTKKKKMASLIDSSFEMEKLSYEIFSILESKFLSTGSSPTSTPKSDGGGKIRILSIDSGDGLLPAISLSRLESSLRAHTGNPDARIADFFDVAAGSGLGGVLASMLFTRGPHGSPLFSAEDALHFLTKNRRGASTLRGLFRKPTKKISKIFSDSHTLRDALKPLLVPCYDLSTGAPFLFSRADAVETEAYDFKIGQICAATCARRKMDVRSVDGRTSISAVGGDVAMTNPTAAAITHVLNNKREFPFSTGVEDLVVLSLGNREGSSKELTKIAANAGADTVDQAIATAFGDHGQSNYVRIQTSLSQRNVESVLFGRNVVSDKTNAEKLEWFSGELVREQQRRKSSPIATVFVKQTAVTPRTSSATNCTTTTSFTAPSTDGSCR